jgi:hypothetical protein
MHELGRFVELGQRGRPRVGHAASLAPGLR